MLPIQPIYADKHGACRFRKNAIVKFLIEAGPFDMNQLLVMDFTNEDREQFAQLIGYSLAGFGELPYVSDETYNTASRMAETGETQEQAHIKHLQGIIEGAREDID